MPTVAEPPTIPDDVPETLALQRRLARLRFDLHDGPQQRIHLLAQDLALFREQLAPVIESHPDRLRALGRLDDLEAQLIALDTDLRHLTTSVPSPLAGGPLPEALAELAATFTARTGLVPRCEITGETDSLTDSQQIALLALIQEALANVRRHADARHVTITLTAGAELVVVEVRDDGSGFEPDVAGPRAAEGGHLGMVAMRERMRMLGGHTEITSAPGGPTVIAATLPRWPAPPPA